jgi:hypothetical protein
LSNDNNNKPSQKKSVYFTDQTKKDLEGFEEVFDLMDNNGLEIKNKRKEGQIEDYEIYDFLEKEVTRLEKLDQFFTVQMPLEKQYPQTKKLIEKETSELHLIKDELVGILSHKTSPLSAFFDDLIRRAL